MSHWEMVKLEDVCILVNGRAYKQEELLAEGTPVIRIQNLNKSDRWYYSNLDLPEDKYCSEGDLLFAWSGTFGPYIWWGSKSIYHYHIWKIIEKNNILKQYLFFFLMSVTQKVKDSGHGIALIHMTKSGMEALPIPLPPLPEQQSIVARLDKAQQLIDQRKEQLKLMDALVQSLFYEMFGDPVKNEKGWEANSLSDVAYFENGDRSSNYPSGNDILSSGILFFGTQNIGSEGYFNTNELKFISKDKFNSLSRGKLNQGDIIISLRGSVGNCCLFYSNDYQTGFINAQLMIIRANNALVNNLYLLHFLRIDKIASKLKEQGSGSAVPQLTASQLKTFKIIMPPLPLQQTFADRVQQIEALKQSMTASLRELEQNFNALMQEAFGV